MTLDLTRPLFAWPHVLTATNHLRVSYNDATSQNVSLVSGHLLSRRNRDRPPGPAPDQVEQRRHERRHMDRGSTARTMDPAITHTGGSKTVSLLSFLTDQLRGADLGFASDTVAASGPQASFIAPWRPARLWMI